MFIIQLFNSPGCSLKLQRELYAGSVEGEKPGDGCANHMATGAKQTLLACTRQLSLWEAHNTQFVSKLINYPLLQSEFYQTNRTVWLR